MIDEIDYFPRRDQHNKKKKIDSGSGWGDLKKEKSEQDNKSEKKKKDEKSPPSRRDPNEQ
jgi:hypothetical protein